MGIWYLLDITSLRIRNFLTPKPDPLIPPKNRGFGWGWFFLIGGVGYGISTASSIPPGPQLLIEIICLPIIAVIYFVIRKRIIEKRRYGNDVWRASLSAGILSYLFAFLLVFLVSFLVLVPIRHTNNENAIKEVNRLAPALVSAVEGLPTKEIERLQNVTGQANEIFRKYLTPDEYAQITSIGLNAAKGLATADDFKRAGFYGKKVRSLSTSMEKETLDEFSRLTQKLRSIKK